MNVSIRLIGKSADDLRFFISANGEHAGGITVHSLCGTSFSYGVAIAREKRNRGIAKAALPLLYAEMKARGFTLARVEIAAENAASLALHTALGFRRTVCEAECVRMEKEI